MRTNDAGAPAHSNLRDSQKTWDEVDISAVRSVAWCSPRTVGERVGRFVTLEAINDLLLDAFRERAQDLKAAAVVCGDMEAERGYFEGSADVRFTEVDGFDLSPQSLNRVRPAGFRFNPRVCDCNDLVLDRERYDMIVATHGLHHVYNLGGLIYQMNKSLRPGGLVVIVEWIGPEKLQIPVSNSLISRVLLYAMFSPKKRRTHQNLVKGMYLQAGPESFDPSDVQFPRDGASVKQVFRFCGPP